eukprot:3755883-Rhodomonas_salina.2
MVLWYYTLPSTAVGYAATSRSAVVLRVCCGMSGTDGGYAATRLILLAPCIILHYFERYLAQALMYQVRYLLRAPYALSGTDLRPCYVYQRLRRSPSGFGTDSSRYKLSAILLRPAWY